MKTEVSHRNLLRKVPLSSLDIEVELVLHIFLQPTYKVLE